MAIYVGGLEASVRIHCLGHSRCPPWSGHRGFGVRAFGQCATGEDPMDLTVQMPVVRQAASTRPDSRVSFGMGVPFSAGWATCATHVRYHALPHHQCRRAVTVYIPHNMGGPARTHSDPGMWAGNVLCVVLWVIWRRIAIHVRGARGPALNSGSLDHGDVRWCFIRIWSLNLDR